MTVLEGGGLVGGLARTVNYKNFRFDIGGHRFFTKIPSMQAMWEEYGLRAADALRGLGLWQSGLVVLSYLRARLWPNAIVLSVLLLGTATGFSQAPQIPRRGRPCSIKDLLPSGAKLREY